MKFRLPGATAIAAALVAMTVAAPLATAPAFAQQPGQMQLTKQMVAPMNEARNAMLAKDWVTAKTKLDAASAQAKTPNDKAQLERLRLYMAAENKDGKQQVLSINALLASGTLTPEETKDYKSALSKAHLDAGDQAASNAAARAFVDEYGGTPDQLIRVADNFMKANDPTTSLIYAQKAVAAARTAGTKPPESWFTLQMRAHNALVQMDKYYAVEEQLVAEYPKEIYWKELIARTQKEPKYGPAIKLDMFRALQAAGVKLSGQELSTAGDEALKRGLPNDALAFLEPAGVTSEFDTKNLATAKTQVAADKAGLAKETADTLKKGDAAALATLGEAHLSYGDNAKAIEVLNAALAKGIADAGEADIAKLHLGIAQYRSGDKDAARTTWATVKADNGAGVLARNWDLISKIK